jgi:hypothetical protein
MIRAGGRWWPAAAFAVLLAACAGPLQAPPDPGRAASRPAGTLDLAPLAAPLTRTLAPEPTPELERPRPEPRPEPRIVKASARLQCVPFARQASGIAIRGNASTWWRAADGRYRRGGRPRVGAVMALKKTRRLRLGHLAVVTAVLNEREILVDQANWLNRGRIHLNTPVRDVSANNDWSVVRVWYTPGRQFGKRRYPVQGFIYPGPRTAEAAPQAEPGPCVIGSDGALSGACPVTAKR